MICFDAITIRNAIAVKYGGKVEALLDYWHAQFDDPRNPKARAPSSKSLYRWVAGDGVPRNVEQVLALGGLLDIDPVGLFDLPDGGLELENAVQQISDGFIAQEFRQRSLSFLLSIFRTHSGWPPSDIAGVFYRRTWSIQDFFHDPDVAQDVYASISIVPEDEPPKLPRVYYFAYRRAFMSLRAWIPYGVVIRSETTARLLHVHGHNQIAKDLAQTQATIAGTHFGKSAAEFRVTSLHPFRLDVDPNPQTRPELYFPA